MSENERDYIRSIERGFAVLLAFDEVRPAPTLGELAGATELSRPAVRRILLTLQRLGYVTGADGRWSLTPRVLSIGEHYSATHALPQAAMPYLLELVETTEEAASLGVLDGTEVVYAARVPVRRIMSINVAVGTRAPAYATSMGRALLAWAPEQEREAVIAQTRFETLTPFTIDSPEGFRAALAEVRERGFAKSIEELERGLISVAAPVRDLSGAVVGVLASSTSTGRRSAESFFAEVAGPVRDAADELSNELGGRASPDGSRPQPRSVVVGDTP